MEVEEIQAVQACKFSRVGNGRNDSNKVGTKGGTVEQYQDDEEDGDAMRVGVGGGGGGGLGFCGGTNEDDGTVSRLRGWQHSSRIFRVSRASGGKDRHSKVLTSKGLRDRRVRLSVSTAIAFYDLQDRLGVDQPSKAVEWLIKAASEAIAELPSLNSSFPDELKQLSEPKQESTVAEQGFDSADVEINGDPNYQHQQQQLQQQLSKSACSSTSETSKCSGLSLSRSELRVNRGKARERAKERAKEKEKEKESESRIGGHQQQHNVNPISQNSSFTELLTAGFSTVSNNTSSTTASAQGSPGGGNEPNFFQRARHWPATPMDYFTTGLFGGASSSSRAHLSSGFSGQMGNSQPQSMAVPPFSLTTTGDSHHELQHFSFVPDHLIPVTATTQQPGGGGGGNDYSLNFTISSGGLAAGYNRGTLQSNSPSPLPHLQRFSPIDGSISNAPFFFGTVAPASTSASLSMENNHLHYHPFSPGFDARLQLCHGDGTRHSDQKGKGKN